MALGWQGQPDSDPQPAPVRPVRASDHDTWRRFYRAYAAGAQQPEALAAARGLSVVRWVTAPDNLAARRLYDGVADAQTSVVYDMSVGATPPAAGPR